MKYAQRAKNWMIRPGVRDTESPKWWVMPAESRSFYGGLAEALQVENSHVSGGGAGRTFILSDLSHRIRQDGYVRQVVANFYTTSPANGVKFKIFRPNGSNYDFVSESEPLTITSTGKQTYNLSTPMACQAGDIIGVWLTSVAFTELNVKTGGVTRFTTGDITGTNVAFGSSVAFTALIDTRGISPFLATTGDSIAEGHNTASHYHGVLHASNGPAGNRTAEIAYQLRNSITFAGGIASTEFSPDTSVSGNATGGRTFILTESPNRIQRDGAIRQIVASFYSVSAVGGVKFKVFRPNGSNYDFVSESEAITVTATGTQTYTLSTPMACQAGDIIGVWMAQSTPTATEINAKSGGVTRYTAGDISSSNVAFGSSVAYTALIDARWIVMGDSDGFEYQNHALGSQTYAWVSATGAPSAVATGAKTILIHCGVNDVSTGRTWAAVEADLNTIKALLGAGQRLFVDEILPWTAGNDTQAATIRTWNSSLATWCAANNATLIVCHDAMGQTRVSTGQLDDLLTAYNQDGVHLTQAGVNAMAAIWRAALDPFLFPAPAPTFAPTLLADLWAWYDASDISSLYQDSGRTTPVVTDGDPVGAASDKSGNARHMLQAGASTLKPTYTTNVQNGLPSFSFDGGDYLDTVATVNSFPLTIVGVARTSATIGTTRGLVSSRNSTTFGARQYIAAANTLIAQIDTPIKTITSAATLAADTTFLFASRFGTTLISQTLNATTANDTHAAAATANIVSLGRLNVNTTSTLMNGHLLEVVIYNRALTADELTQVQTYLNTKWAVY